MSHIPCRHLGIILLCLCFANCGGEPKQAAEPTPANKGDVKTTAAALLASDGAWGNTEGPTVNSKGTLYFCSRGTFKGIISWNEKEGPRQFLAVAEKEGPGGLWVDEKDNIFVTATGERQILKITPAKKVSVVAQSFEADPKTAKGPNDVVVAKNGTVYFTDPNGYYGDAPPGTVYRVAPDGKTSVFSASVLGPNGIALTADEKTLMVSGNIAKTTSKITRWPLKDDGSAGDAQDVATVNDCVADGMAVDRDGSIWLTCYSFGNAYRIAPDGKIQEKVTTEQKGLTNVRFGRAGLNDTLFLTSSDMERVTGYVYRARVSVPGIRP
jgi:gluconolactonase